MSAATEIRIGELREVIGDLYGALFTARESLIDHARQLPLSKREHGPVLDVIERALARADAVTGQASP